MQRRLGSTPSALDVLHAFDVLEGQFPLRAGGFEVYATCQRPYDFQQCVRAVDAPRLLTERGFSLFQQEFVRTWLTEPEVQSMIPDLWLEFDTNSDGSLPSQGSLFVHFTPEVTSEAPVSKTLRSGLSGLGEIFDRLDTLAGRLTEEQKISHLGLMCPRPRKSHRVNIQGCKTAEEVLLLLGRLDWRGDSVKAKELVTFSLSLSSILTVCLDIGQGIEPSLGLECGVDWSLKRDDGDNQIDQILKKLETSELCNKNDSSVVREWGGILTPRESYADWPFSLAVESLLAPPSKLPIVVRRVSHIKLSLDTSGEVRAKAYLWFSREYIGEPSV